jgi:hypothetical protein
LRDMLLSFTEQGKSSLATAPSSPQPPRGYIGQWHARIYQGHNAIREGEEDGEDNDRRQWGKQGEKRPRQDKTEEVISDIYQSEGSHCSHNTNDEDVEDDEDEEEPRPAERRKLSLASIHTDLPPLATQLEVDDTQSLADLGNSLTTVDDEQHHIIQSWYDDEASS